MLTDDGRTDGRRIPLYTKSSPMSLRLRWANNTCNLYIYLRRITYFSITASLPYGPPVNTDIDYYQTFFGLVYFCKYCEFSCAIFFVLHICQHGHGNLVSLTAELNYKITMNSIIYMDIYGDLFLQILTKNILLVKIKYFTGYFESRGVEGG